jgi:apolipoprotein D and lipocalin family protein
MRWAQRSSSALNRTLPIFAAALSTALSACGPHFTDGHRDAETELRSLALFEQSSLSGRWYPVAFYPLKDDCKADPVSFGPGGTSLAADGCALPGGSGVLASAGPGRFSAGGAALWVLWADADNRTLVLGTPSGRFGAVLNRDPAIPADRLRAAMRVLEFNGYRTTEMVHQGG